MNPRELYAELEDVERQLAAKLQIPFEKLTTTLPDSLVQGKLVQDEMVSRWLELRRQYRVLFNDD